MKLTVALLLLLSFTMPLWAQEKDELYSVDADTVNVDESEGVTTYQGNARAKVANLVIEADTILVFRDRDTPTRVEASGSPLKFHQKSSSDSLSGTAQQIVFSIAELKLTLLDYSFADATGNKMSGQKATFVLSP